MAKNRLSTFTHPNIMVGIDPGVKTGMAVWDVKERKFMKIWTDSFWGAIGYLETMTEIWAHKFREHTGPLIPDHPVQFHVYLEDTTAIKTMYHRHRHNTGAKLNSIAQKVGMNKRDSQLLAEWCLSQPQITLVQCPPGGRKWDKETFRGITKYEGSLSQHGIDAGVLVYGRI